jgi:hypothetical protein
VIKVKKSCSYQDLLFVVSNFDNISLSFFDR